MIFKETMAYFFRALHTRLPSVFVFLSVPPLPFFLVSLFLQSTPYSVSWSGLLEAAVIPLCPVGNGGFSKHSSYPSGEALVAKHICKPVLTYLASTDVNKVLEWMLDSQMYKFTWSPFSFSSVTLFTASLNEMIKAGITLSSYLLHSSLSSSFDFFFLVIVCCLSHNFYQSKHMCFFVVFWTAAEHMSLNIAVMGEECQYATTKAWSHLMRFIPSVLIRVTEDIHPHHT